MSTAPRLVFSPRATSLPYLAGKGRALGSDSNELRFWQDLLGTENLSTTSNDVEYLPVRGNLVRGEVLIHRKCYPHMVSRIIHCWNHENRECLVTGTPGIGKTIFGFFLIRHLWRKKLASAIVYVFQNSLYLITNDQDIQRELGVSDTVSVFDDSSLNVHNNVLLMDKRMTVVHDPALGAEDPTLDMGVSAPCRVFILPYGHQNRVYFAKKNVGPPLESWFCTPPWSREEGHQCQSVLEPFISIDEAIYVFGGMVRKWLQPRKRDSFEKMKLDLVERIEAVVKQHPRGDIQNHTDEGVRGTLVQMGVYFDEKADLWRSDRLLSSVQPIDTSPQDVIMQDAHSGSAANDTYEEGTVPATENTSPNSFKDMSFYVGSSFILEQLIHASENLGADHHSVFLKGLKSESGFQDMYGRIFEPYCHSWIKKSPDRQLLIRRLTLNKNASSTEEASMEAQHKITLPLPKTIIRFDGHDPKALKNEQPGWCSDGNYVQPYSTTFPSYDSIYVVSENVLRNNGSTKLIALNFQMAVSGATGIPPRPKHALHRYIRSGINKVCKDAESNFHESVTVFAVPQVCFDSFRFQKEFIKDSKTYATYQPKEQYVVAIPESVFPIGLVVPEWRKRTATGQ